MYKTFLSRGVSTAHDTCLRVIHLETLNTSSLGSSIHRISGTMEALGIPNLNTLTSPNPKPLTQRRARFTEKHCLESPAFSPLKFKLSFTESRRRRSRIRMSAAEDDDPARQMKEMAKARKRWEALLREGKVNGLSPREAGYAIQLSNKPLLDVRPSAEHLKAWVKGSEWIPIFDVDNRFDLGTISRKITNFMMGGWWSGVPTLSYNSQFLRLVEEKFPKDIDLIVACQKGLRSLAACEQLYNAGYRNLFWVQGGLEAAEEEDLEREGPVPFKFAGIGGVSEFLGWTDQQRVAAAKEGWQYRLVFSARLIGLFILADALFIGAQQGARYLQELRFH